jgi:phosphate starvation-inducible PhoH-like protein
VASDVLKGIDDIAFCNLTSADVVRHPLVQKIVKAYEDYEKKSANKQTKKKIQKLERNSSNGR